MTEYICKSCEHYLVCIHAEKTRTACAMYSKVVHAGWKYYHKQNIAVCTNCSFERDLNADFGKAVCCPNCGAMMDKE